MTRAVPPAVAHEAVEWLLEWETGGFTEDRRAAWRRWLERDTAHASAWERIAHVDARLRSVPADIAIDTLASPGLQRRRSARLALLLAGGVAAMEAGRHTATWRQAVADIATATGERRETVLPDGTRLTLNTGSAVDLRFDATARRLLLRAGEILVETARDERVFTVETADGRVAPVGTRFTVRQHAGSTAVAVLAGAVDLQPSGRGRPALRLAAGRCAEFDSRQVLAENALPAGQAAWAEGMMVADAVRLADFVGELSRYRPGLLRCTQDASELRVSGAYPVADTDRVLAALALSLPIRVEYRSRWWVTVARR